MNIKPMNLSIGQTTSSRIEREQNSASSNRKAGAANEKDFVVCNGRRRRFRRRRGRRLWRCRRSARTVPARDRRRGVSGIRPATADGASPVFEDQAHNGVDEEKEAGRAGRRHPDIVPETDRLQRRIFPFPFR